MDQLPIIAPVTSKEGDHSPEAMLPLVYDELRRLAYEHMARQSPEHTLQPTALVHEAWIKIARGQGYHSENRSSFLSMASTAMRHILIDHARSKMSLKRGGDRQRVEPEQMDETSHASSEIILRVNDALEYLEQERPVWARIVEMKYFGGMTNKEVADALGKSESTIERYWSAAKAWLHKQLVSQA